jgi:transcriptional antiterminator RfaH
MTKPKMESTAKEHLERQGFEVYLPQWLELKRRQGSWQQVQSPMFPRYLFVRARYAEQSLAPIRSTWGVSQLVRFGQEPARAHDGLVREIRQLEDRRNSMCLDQTPFKKGEQVLILDGPFKGVSAKVFSCNHQRVILLLQVLGKDQQLEFKTSMCQAK